ncbi:hypothetical protein [Rhodococcus sp. MEB041]|uniref:hypothetical protein n=1 Tax=Rhodococcus sp. MEB041 TaxID=3040323 RepID=UPI00254BE692|nr:hypothetical protein [Rhodococcus sp. MEB041]
MSNTDAVTELSELARRAAWGLMKGGDLDAMDSGKNTLLLRLDILEAAARAGIVVDLDEHGIGTIYTREELTELDKDFRPRDPATGRVVR